MDLIVTIDPHMALLSGCSRAGLQIVDLDPAALSAEQRALLGRHTRPYVRPDPNSRGDRDLRERLSREPGEGALVLTSCAPNAATIEAALSACAAVEQRAAEQRAAEIEAIARRDAAILAIDPETPDALRVPWHSDASPEIVAWRERRDAAQARREAAREAALLAVPDERWPSIGGAPGTPGHHVIPPYHAAGVDHGGRAISGESRAVRDRARAIEAARDAAASSDREARERARRDQIARCVREWGDASQRERLADGVLPEREAISLIQERALAPLAGRPTRDRIRWEDLPHDEDCIGDDREPSCDRETAAELGPTEYAALREIRTLAAQAAAAIGAEALVEPRAHTCSCDSSGCSASITRLGALVRLSWGALNVSREYAL